MAMAVASAPSISVEEYIARFVDRREKPTCEFVDGELIPKPMATKKHSQVQGNLIRLIGSRYDETLNPLPELTTRLRETRFYVPDLAIEDLAKPIQGRYPGPNDPVLLCVEIVSPPDRVGKLFGKCEEYHKWGVPYCWVIDPERKSAWEYFPSDPEPRRVENSLTAGPILLDLAEVFRRV
jgi:Uma2 family endonuclease